jgi:hypothetical protein
MWFYTLLNNDMIADGRLVELISNFHLAFIENAHPSDMALFAGRSTYDDEIMQIATRIYFSPTCNAYIPSMALKFAFVECEKPDKGELTLLIGTKDAFELIDTMNI